MFEDANRVNRSYNLKKDRKYNGQKKKDKRTNNSLQNITQKGKDRAPRPNLKTRGEHGVIRSCSTCGSCRFTLVTNPIINHKSGKDRTLITTNGTYP